MVPHTQRQEVQGGGQGRMNLSFAGCGFLGIYHVGVASCFKEYAPHLVSDKISGASAGALAATALITGCCLGECTSYTLRIAAKARARALGPLHPSFNIVQILREGLDDFFPDNAHIIASGRLHVSLTRVSDRENVIVSQFDSKEDLIQALVCSSFVPFYCGLLPPKYKGVRYVDGGLSNNIPILDDDTITVSPFAGESDICPTDRSSNDMHIHVVNTSIQCTVGNLYRASHAFFPPHPEVLGRMCKQGFDDALKFLQKNNLISCTRHLSIQSSIMADEPLDFEELGAHMHYETSSEEEDDEDEVDEHPAHADSDTCVECRHRRHVALLQDSLPDSVVSALQAACDSVNNGLLASIYNLRAYKVISLMAAPWLLPLDLVVELGRRVYEWAPYLPSDMQWFTKEFVLLLDDMLHFLRHGRHKYSARFTCQLAITEMDYNQDNVISQPATPGLPRRAKKQHYVPSRRRNLNVGFSVDFQSNHREPLRFVDEVRHQLCDDPEKLDSQLNSRRSSRRSSRGELDMLQDLPLPKLDINKEVESDKEDLQNSTYDEFSNCLHIANQMESVLSFYYSEEDNPNVVKVTEIFAMEQDLEGSVEPSELMWDNYVERKQSEDTSSLKSNETLPFGDTLDVSTTEMS